MEFKRILTWLQQGRFRLKLLGTLFQPMTVAWLSTRSNISWDYSWRLVKEFFLAGIVECLTPEAQQGRIYSLTKKGVRCHRFFSKNLSFEPLEQEQNIDWSVLAWLSSTHRTAFVQALTNVMQPCEIRKSIVRLHPALKISQSNVYDLVYLFEDKNVIQRVPRTGQRRAVYELRKEYLPYQQLLRRLLIPPHVRIANDKQRNQNRVRTRKYRDSPEISVIVDSTDNEVNVTFPLP